MGVKIYKKCNSFVMITLSLAFCRSKYIKRPSSGCWFLFKIPWPSEVREKLNSSPFFSCSNNFVEIKKVQAYLTIFSMRIQASSGLRMLIWAWKSVYSMYCLRSCWSQTRSEPIASKMSLERPCLLPSKHEKICSILS